MFSNSRFFSAFSMQRIIVRQQHQQQKPHEGFAYRGNPYETKLNLKREIADISYPNFEEVECLKWSDWRMLRDVKRRYIHADYWQKRVNLKNLAKNRALPSLVRDIAWEDRMATPRNSSLNHLTNRCVLTSRARGKFPRYRISRLIFRDCADHGQLSGYIRAKWG